MAKHIGCAEVDKNGQHAGLQDVLVLSSGHAASLLQNRKRMIQSSKEYHNENDLVSGSIDSFNSKRIKKTENAPQISCLRNDYTNSKNNDYSSESSDGEKNSEAYRRIENIIMNDETDKESISYRGAMNLAHTSGGTTIQAYQSEMTHVPGSSKSIIAPLIGTSQSAKGSDNAHPSSSVNSDKDLETCRKKVGVGPSIIDVTGDDSLGIDESNNNDISIDSYKGNTSYFE